MLGSVAWSQKVYDLPDAGSVSKAWDKIHGVNYLPSYAASPYQCWNDYKPEVIRKELGLARKIGFNSVRVFLSFTCFESKPTLFLTNFSDFAQACKDQGMSVMPVLFDSWGVEVDPQDRLELLGAGLNPGEPRREPLAAAYKRFLSLPQTYRIDAKRYERLLRTIAEASAPDRMVPLAKDPSVPFWGEWLPSPGRERMGKKDWPACKEFVKKVIEPFKDDSFIAAWDIMNEPDALRVFDADPPPPTAAYDFAAEMTKEAKKAGPSQPLTVGTAGGLAGARVFMLKEDLVSLHVFQRPISEMLAEIREAGKRGKPVVLTAGGAFLFPTGRRELSDEGQEELLRKTVEPLVREKTGFYLWHLIEGKGITPWSALVRENGELKPAAVWLNKTLTP